MYTKYHTPRNHYLELIDNLGGSCLLTTVMKAPWNKQNWICIFWCSWLGALEPRHQPFRWDNQPNSSPRVSGCLGLTHWGQDKMTAIFQTTVTNAFSCMKMYWFLIKISLNFIPKGPINNIPALATSHYLNQIMVRLLTHICVTRPQWVNSGLFRCDLVSVAVNW